ncbi:hypothetical protein GW931_02125 [archaeon]|nr:hypothetical protein [archaeon]PJC45603.1 MAG: hypothetical protein CO037_00635 [Candidatus Pacearchaeota archaeon CG_4_9_14_0_2_um_filter_30_8]
MKKKLIGLTLNGKKRNVEVFKVPWWYEGIGLMFQRRSKAKALIFEFRKPVSFKIHSFFVFFPFLAIWLNSKNKVIYSRVINPFNFGFSPSEKFVKLIEIPFNKSYDFLEFPSSKRKI